MPRSDEVERLLPLTPVTLQILLSLYDGVKHGYGMKHEVEERTGGRVRLGAGTLYEALRRLEKTGLVEEVDRPADAPADTVRWRFYRLTAVGTRVLREEVRRLEADVRAARAKGLRLAPEEGR